MVRAALRRDLIARRLALTTEEVARRSEAIISRVEQLPAYGQARVLMTYVAFRQEVETRELIRRALAHGKQVVVPRVDREEHRLLAVAIDGLQDLFPGAWGIPEPKAVAGRTVAPSAIDLVIVPGVAFDRCGNRLGYGGGYYDRFLPTLRPAAAVVALAYGFQVLQELPPGPHDVPVQYVVTEDEVIVCRRKGEEAR